MKAQTLFKSLAVLAVVAMLLPLAVAPRVEAQTPTPVPASLTQGNADRTLVWIPKTTNSTYWLAVLAGAKKAAAELGYKDVLYKGTPSQTDIAGQVNLVNDEVQAKVAGILIAATDAKALVSPVEAAIKAGVPVVTLDSGIDSKAPYAYIATDNVAVGEDRR